MESTPITGHDVLIYMNIGATVAGFFMLYLKHDRRMGKLETDVKAELATLKTHLFHIMRSLSMRPRDPETDLKED